MKDHRKTETQAARVRKGKGRGKDSGQYIDANQGLAARMKSGTMPSLKSKTGTSPKTESGGQSGVETHREIAPVPSLKLPDLMQVIGTLMQYSNIYERFVSAHTKLILQLKAMARWYKIPGEEVDKLLKGKSHLESETQSRTAKSNGEDNGQSDTETQWEHAAEIGDHLAAETHHAAVPDISQAFLQNALPFIDSLEAIGSRREHYGKEIGRLAKMLPVWPWVRDEVCGMAELRLGLLIGATGDLTAGKVITRKIWRGDRKTGKLVEETIASYTNPAKVWKRMGVGLVGDKIQRLVRQHSVARDGKLVTSEDNVALAQEMGYNPKRRALMHMIGEGIVMAGKGKYREIYDARRAFEEAQHPDWKPKQHPGHWNKRAMRYMEKRLLKDLWEKWNIVCGINEVVPSIKNLSRKK